MSRMWIRLAGATLLVATLLPSRAQPVVLAQPAGLGQTLSDVSEGWRERGEDDPRAVLAELAQPVLPVGGGAAPAWQRMRARTRGLVAARSGMQDEVSQALAALTSLESDVQDDPRWRAGLKGDRALIQAQLHDLRGDSAAAVRFGHEADRAYELACGSRQPAPDCDYRAWWQALHLLAQRADVRGDLVAALSLAERAHSVAGRAADLGLEAWSLALQAVFQQALSHDTQARTLMAQADRLAHRQNDGRAELWVRFIEARMALADGDAAAALRLMQQARRLALATGSARLEAQILPSLSDLLRRAGRPREALQVVQQAYPVLQRHHELRGQPTLLHNGGLAKLQLGQVAQGRADLEMALQLWQTAGARGAMAVALQEGSDALADLGDVRGALDLLHRSQDLRAAVNADNQTAILSQMRATYRTESERRELDLLERENALRSSHLQTQVLIERVWIAAIILLGLAGAVVGLLVLRARDATRRLRHSEALLRVQSERDPLTGLANRRHFREVLATQGAGFQGALMLVDIDHFKRINDEFGHPAGDAVLVEVARRLDSSVRAGDLVCRWGGEEFLIYAPDLQGESLDALALRVLRALGDEAIPLGEKRVLPISASLGYAAFPLPVHAVALGWERAVNLVDMALYTAKSMGRDRAVGLQSVRAADSAALETVEADFEAARLAGDVSLSVTLRWGA